MDLVLRVRALGDSSVDSGALVVVLAAAAAAAGGTEGGLAAQLLVAEKPQCVEVAFVYVDVASDAAGAVGLKKKGARVVDFAVEVLVLPEQVPEQYLFGCIGVDADVAAVESAAVDAGVEQPWEPSAVALRVTAEGVEL